METPKKVIIDARGRTYGRLASTIAHHLRGKHLVTFSPNLNPKVIVEVTNLKEVRFTGRKLEQRRTKRYTGYPGGLRYTLFRDQWAKNPEKALRSTVRRMLPANRLRPGLLKNLTIHS